MLSDPMYPDWHGKDLSKLKDLDGNRIFPNLLEVGKSKGEAFFDYMWTGYPALMNPLLKLHMPDFLNRGIWEYVWDKPGESEPMLKISYVRLYEPYGWIIGTGIYVDDVQKKINAKEEE